MPPILNGTNGSRLLLVALPLVFAAIGIAGYSVLNWTSDRIVARQAERISLAWAKEFALNLDRIEEIASGAPLNEVDLQFIGHARGLGDVFLFKLFDRTGNLRLVSGAQQTSIRAKNDLRTHNEIAARVVAEGRPHTQLMDGTSKPARPDIYVESYVPITRDGIIVAIVEVYVDQTEAAKIVKSDFAQFGLESAGLTLLALLLPVLALFRLSWVLRQRNRALQTEQERARAAEDRLLQAQRMEAVGQLTGGIAHDFNNLLAVIVGNSELLEDQLGQDNSPLKAIFLSASRAAELTQRLLAFSRQQPLQPQTIDMASLVHGMSELMVRTLGETIEIKTSIAPGLWNAVADPGQVENALLNLALNARDAMPDGGKLSIECTNSRRDFVTVTENPDANVGDYVVLVVSDAGHGMSADVQSRAFEPFFTTKDVGEGSGLGLSMVYGFAKQSGGYATIYSEEEIGTTVKLYLPRSEVAQTAKEALPIQLPPLGNGEYILVIEDNPDVRALSVQTLKGLGYQVVDVPDAGQARKALANGHLFDLVLSDVVLPGGLSGPEFAREVHENHSDLKFIFMSGYPMEAAKHNGLLNSGEVLLNKPFQRQKLAETLRAVLD